MRPLKEIKDNPKVTVLYSCADGIKGFVRLRDNGKPRDYSIIVGTNLDGYEHVDISSLDIKHLPTWNEMCELKEICFEDEEEVIQVHPKKTSI